MLLEQYKNDRKVRSEGGRKDAGKIGRIICMPALPQLFIFKAVFAKRTVRAEFLVDQGAGASFLSEHLCKRIKKSQSGDIKKKLDRHRVCKTFTENLAQRVFAP